MSIIRFGIGESETRTISEVVYHALKTAIVSGDLPMGNRINEKLTAQEMGVSATPVREALRRLERDGLVVVEVHRGTFVANFGPDDARDLYDVRLGLEIIAAKRVLQANRVEDLNQLVEALKASIRGIEARDPELWRRSDHDFHSKLVDMARNVRLSETFQRIYNQIHVLRRGMPPTWEKLERASVDHRKLIEGIEARDEGVILSTLQEHIERARDDAIARSRSIPSSGEAPGR